MAQTVDIGQCLKRIRRPVAIEDDVEYQLVTIRLKHGGIVERCRKRGKDIGTKRMYRVHSGDFILSGIDARNGAFGIVPPELDGAVVTNDFWYFDVNEDVISTDLFLALTETSWFDHICRLGSDGTTQRIRLQKDKFFNQTITLPSIQEQPGILKHLQKHKETGLALKSEIEKQNAMLAKYRQAILQEAIEGKLTADWRETHPDVEPAAELLKRIADKKAVLITQKKIRKQKSLPQLRPDEISFDIPVTWQWCQLEHVFQFIDYRGKTPKKSPSGVRLITAKNIKMGYIDEHPIEFMSDDNYKKWMTRGFPSVGDVLFVTEGHTMGCVAEIDKSYAFAIAQRTINLKAYLVDSFRTATYFIMTGYFQDLLKRKATGSAAMGVKASVLKGLALPIPPIAEQKEILRRADVKFALCDELEMQISRSMHTAETLSAAILQELFDPNGAPHES